MTPSVALVLGAVPARAVLTVGEDADRQHAEGAAHAVHGDRTHRVVDAAALDEAGRRR